MMTRTPGPQSFPTRTIRRRVHGVASALSCVLLLSLLIVPGYAAAPAEAFKPFKLKTLDGEQKTLSDVLGSKATLVVFFFPTCRFCNEAFPGMQKLHDTYKDQGLSMVWINAVPSEARLIAGWKKKYGYTVPVLVGASIRAVEKDYKVSMTPTHYLLDAGGNVISTHAGYKAGDENLLEEHIKRALE